MDVQKIDYLMQVQMSTQKIMKLLSQLNQSGAPEDKVSRNLFKDQLEDSVSCKLSLVQAQSLNGSKWES